MQRKKIFYDHLPNDKEIARIPLSAGAEFDLSDKEVRQLRYHLYQVNRDGIRRYRTLRMDSLLLVWRIK